MFSTRFLRGGLKTSVVHVYCTDSKGTRDFRFHWLENEDSEDIAQRFEAQLNQELVEWGREAPGSGDVPAAAVLPAPIPANARVPVSTSLQIEKTSNDSADHEVLLHILGILRVHELHELLFKEQCKYLDRTTGADQLDTLTVLDLTSCGLTEVPASICNLHNLKTFVMSKNKLTSLPHFIGTLQQLVNLNADDNTLTSLPDSLKSLTSLHTLSFSNNALAAPIIDLSALQHLAVLHLGGNPLTYVPELSQASALHIVSLASLHISADPDFTSWTVQVLKPPPRVSMRSRGTTVDAALKLLLSRSSLQHPLIAGGLAEMARDTEHRASMLRAERLLPQLVHAMLAEHTVVAVQSCEALVRLAQEPGVAATLAAAATLSSALKLMAAPKPQLQVAGLKVLAAMAVASEAVAQQALTEALIEELLTIAKGSCAEARCAALKALSSLAFPAESKETLMQSAALLDTVEQMASAEGGACDQVRAAAVRVLAVLGQNDKVDKAVGKHGVHGRGLRVLALDGGGMKGMAEVTMLRELERRTGKPIQDLFDIIGGTSTGCMIAMGMGVMRFTLDDMEEVYMDLGSRVFNSGSTTATVPAADKGPPDEPVSPRTAKQAAATGQSWSEMLTRMYRSGEQGVRVAMYGAKHNTALFEELLQERTNARTLGCVDDLTVDASWLGGPRVFGCATHASVSPARPYVFRTYEFPPGEASKRRAERLALHEGTSKHRIWQAVRASSAAPYYLDDFSIGDLRFCDGAVTVNNPAVIAVQEARMLYPGTPIDCVVSLGVGHAPSASRPRGMHSYLDVGSAVVESACSVDRPHEALACMLEMSGCLYERLNPEDRRCEVALDCTDRGTIQSLVDAATQYISEHGEQFDRICEVLLAPGDEEEEASPPASVGISLTSRPHCLILAAPVTGAAEPLCHVGKFLRALQCLPDTTTVQLADWHAGVCSTSTSPVNSSQQSVSPAQDKAAFGSVVLTAAAEAPSVAARLVGHPKRSPQSPSEPQMPHLPRLQTGHASPATVTSAHGPTLSSSSAAESGATVAPWHTQTWLGQQQMPQSRGGDALSEKPERSADLSSGQPGGPYHVREGPCPSSPAALTVPSKPPGAPKAVSIFGHDTVVDVQHDNEALPAPEVLEMRHLGEAQASPRHAQRLESEESGSLMRMLTAMMAWSPTHTPTTTERTDAASDQHGHSRRLHVEADAAPGSDGAPDAGGSRDHEGNHRGEQAAPQSVDDSEPDNSLVDDRSTLVDALPAEPDLAAAPRSSFECSDHRLLGFRAEGSRPASAQTTSRLPFRDAGAWDVAAAGERLAPIHEAPTGFVIIGAHPHVGGIIASYEQRYHAVVDPSDEATVLKLRLQGASARNGSPGQHAPLHEGSTALWSVLRGGRLVREPNGDGAWWRCMSRTTQEFPAVDGGLGVTVEALTLQEVVPGRVLRGGELRAALAPVHGGVAVLVADGCEALVQEAFDAGAAAVLVIRGDMATGRTAEGTAAAAAVLGHAVQLMRGGERPEVAMRESGCDQHFALVVAPSSNSGL